MKTLNDTIPSMLSKDWKERLVAEIEQLDIRLYNLECHMEKIGEDSPEYSLLKAQRDSMTEYLKTLTARATTFEISYTLPSIQERMKKIPMPAQFDFSKCSNIDPMFLLFMMFYLCSTKGGE